MRVRVLPISQNASGVLDRQQRPRGYAPWKLARADVGGATVVFTETFAPLASPCPVAATTSIEVPVP
jgi:hypothetical protein